MNMTTRTALEQSIAKWEAIVEGTGADWGTENCSLCKEFLIGGDGGCIGCPVKDASFSKYCADTPYDDWAFASRVEKGVDEFPFKATTPHLVTLAQNELDFLRSLLPPNPEV